MDVGWGGVGGVDSSGVEWSGGPLYNNLNILCARVMLVVGGCRDCDTYVWLYVVGDGLEECVVRH